MLSSPCVIAEAGVNHNGQLDLACELATAARDAGADVVKFQTFKAINLVTEQATQAAYQSQNSGRTESQLEMLKRLELSQEDHLKLAEHCRSLGIEFLSTAFEKDSLDFLHREMGLERLKIPSGELTNAPLVLQHAQTGCDLIVSTGMASLGEIEQALGVVAFGYLTPNETPSENAFRKAYLSEEGQALLQQKVTLLHCTSEYPAPLNSINLRTMATLRNSFGLPVGYSDHSEGLEVPIAATALGARVIEKHFTLSREMEGPDHKASIEPMQLKNMIESIRVVHTALGRAVKGPGVQEIDNMAVVRKSLVAAKDIEANEAFSQDNLSAKRPGGGMSPYRYWSLLGRPASRAYGSGDLIDER